MRVGQGFKWEPVTCPLCGMVMNGQAPVDDAGMPDEGSVGICIYCGTVSVFGEGGASLREPTEAEWEAINADERVAACVEAVRKVIADEGP